MRVDLLVSRGNLKSGTNRSLGMALTDTFVKNVKPTGSVAGDKHTDGQGL